MTMEGMPSPPQDHSSDPQRPATATGRRRWRRSALIAVPFVLLFVLVMAPQWTHDRQLDGLVGRVLSHPLPSETRFSDDEVDASVALRGNSNHCDYRVRFNLQTKRSVDEVVRHYEAARIGIAGGGVSVVVWTPSKNPSNTLTFDDKLIIVELQDNFHDPSWDLRCH